MIKQYRGADRALSYLFEHANEVEVTQLLTTGTPSATIEIDGTQIILYSDDGQGLKYQAKQTLIAGNTSLVFTNINPYVGQQSQQRIFNQDLSDMMVHIYTDILGVCPMSIIAEGTYTDSSQVVHEDGRLSLTFEAQQSNMVVMIDLRKGL